MTKKSVGVTFLLPKVGLKGNDIETGRREPSLLPVLITELHLLVESKSKQTLYSNYIQTFYSITEWFNMQAFIYKKISKKKFYVVTYIWPTLFSSIAF